MRARIVLVSVIAVLGIVTSVAAVERAVVVSGQETNPTVVVTIDCAAEYSVNKVCPKEQCVMVCADGSVQAECTPTCLPRPCFEIGLESCPLSRCQVVNGCGGVDICYENNRMEAPSCGGLAYLWPDVECCDGLVRRCGIEYFDGSCDMAAAFSEYAVPICLPCGNGICNQFENRCNCPEDCGK